MGAKGQDRTGDTGIFSAVLYRLSYLGSADLGLYLPPANTVKAAPTLGVRHSSVVQVGRRGVVRRVIG